MVNVNCPATYGAVTSGTFQTTETPGSAAFYNEWSNPVTVVVYNPSTTQVVNRVIVASRANNLVVEANVSVIANYGICFEGKPDASGVVNILKDIANADPNWQGGRMLYMIQNTRIK
ncbi:hypothetical protein [Nostoc sp.]|uniref:hypothetical protein n=1 Tax=Nostoc sp. TaxID=1180 RepID=UPI002FF704BE